MSFFSPFLGGIIGILIAEFVLVPALKRWRDVREARKMKKLLKARLDQLAAEQRPHHPNCRFGFEPLPVPAGRIEADDKARTITVTVFDHGMDGADRVIVKASGRKDRVVLLKPYSRKMAKAKPVKIKPTRPKSTKKLWSMKHSCCVICASTKRPHHSKGRCRTCFSRTYKRPTRKK